MLRVLNPPKAKQLLPRQPGGNTYGGHPELFRAEPWIWNPGFPPSRDLCTCPLFHRNTCQPGFRTLMFTAGPRIRKASCCGCSERRSTWPLPGALCPPFRWYPCDHSHLQSVPACSHSILPAELVGGTQTPEHLFYRVPCPLSPRCPRWASSASVSGYYRCQQQTPMTTNSLITSATFMSWPDALCP